jgi:hypothetical protein
MPRCGGAGSTADLQRGESEIRRYLSPGASTVAALLRIAIAIRSLIIAPCHPGAPGPSVLRWISDSPHWFFNILANATLGRERQTIPPHSSRNLPGWGRSEPTRADPPVPLFRPGLSPYFGPAPRLCPEVLLLGPAPMALFRRPGARTRGHEPRCEPNNPSPPPRTLRREPSTEHESVGASHDEPGGPGSVRGETVGGVGRRPRTPCGGFADGECNLSFAVRFRQCGPGPSGRRAPARPPAT